MNVDDTPTFTPSDTAFVQDPARPVLAHGRTLRPGQFVDPHRHPRGQLLWAMQGVLRVSSGDSVWIVPPSHAVWIAGGVRHQVMTETQAEIRNLYVDPQFQPELCCAACCVLVMTPLMRALILKLCAADLSAPFDDRAMRLAAVAVDEIAALEEAPLSLPGGQDARLVRLTRHLGQHPDDPRPLAALSALAGASPRTLERLFRKETGLTFRQWRSRLRLLSSIERLNRGQSSTEIAHSLGYSSASAFVAAFRMHFGTPPQSFLQS